MVEAAILLWYESLPLFLESRRVRFVEVRNPMEHEPASLYAQAERIYVCDAGSSRVCLKRNVMPTLV
jgi:hypothetical protein